LPQPRPPLRRESSQGPRDRTHPPPSRRPRRNGRGKLSSRRCPCPCRCTTQGCRDYTGCTRRDHRRSCTVRGRRWRGPRSSTRRRPRRLRQCPRHPQPPDPPLPDSPPPDSPPPPVPHPILHLLFLFTRAGRCRPPWSRSRTTTESGAWRRGLRDAGARRKAIDGGMAAGRRVSHDGIARVACACVRCVLDLPNCRLTTHD
jgi:hypothetical protein